MAASSVQFELPDEETFNKEIGRGSGALQVVEVYAQWCGPTKAVVSTFKRFALENPDAAVKFYTVCSSKVPALVKHDKCEPTFLFFKDGKSVEEVAGVQLPKLTRLIQQLSSATAAAAAQRSSSSGD